MRISREGLIILFFGLLAMVAFLRSGIALTLLTGMVFLFIPLSALVWVYIASKSIEVKREIPDEGVAGEQVFGTYRLTTKSTLPSFGIRFTDTATRGYVSGDELTAVTGTTLRESSSVLGRFMKYLGVTVLEEVDQFAKSFYLVGLEGEFPVNFPPLIRGNWHNKKIPLTFPVRGKYRVGPGIVEVGDPFGIFSLKIEAEGFSETLILPTWQSLRYFPIGGRSIMLKEEINPLEREGTSPEFFGIREYHTGDPLKTVHWKLTAKHRRIIVKQFTQQVESNWGIILDLKKGYNAGEGRETSLEYMIEIAASLLELFDEERVPHILAIAANELQVIENLRGEKSNYEELRMLAGCTNDGSENLMKRAASLTSDYPQVSWILITSRKDKDIADSVEILGRYGAAVLVTHVEMISFISDDLPQNMIQSWRKMWGVEMESFDDAILASGAKIFKIRKGDDLSNIYFS